MKKLAKWLVVRFLDFVHWWHSIAHSEIERRIISEYIRTNPRGNEDGTDFEQVSKMREFYFQRITTVAGLIVAISSVAVSLVALIVAVVALKSGC